MRTGAAVVNSGLSRSNVLFTESMWDDKWLGIVDNDVCTAEKFSPD